MNSRALIQTALQHSTSSGIKLFADRLFAHWFSRLVYVQVWEDPEADLHAMQLAPGSNIVTIASGGCNALAYLRTNPAAVHAVDVNGAHLAVLELKQKALKHLVDYPAVLAFLGKANLADNNKRYQRHIRQHLSNASARFWESRSITGKPRYRIFSQNAYQHGLLGNAIGLAHWLVRLSGGDMSATAQAPTLEEQKRRFDKKLAPVFNHPLVRAIASQPFALYSFGIPLSQFYKLKKTAQKISVKENQTNTHKGMHQLFKERVCRLACNFPLAENCFAQQAFNRRYDTEQQSALPSYLQEQHYPALRQNIDRVYRHHTTLTNFLQRQPRASMDAFVLHDTQDWMDTAQLIALWEQITRTAAPGAKVIFRTAGTESPITNVLPPYVHDQWHTDHGQNQASHAMDRAGIYGAMYVYQRP